MQHGLVDVVIVGSDRTTAKGDVCNKIGTYLKALAARDNSVPFTQRFRTRQLISESKMGSVRFQLKNAVRMRFIYFEKRHAPDKLRRSELPLGLECKLLDLTSHPLA